MARRIADVAAMLLSWGFATFFVAIVYCAALNGPSHTVLISVNGRGEMHLEVLLLAGMWLLITCHLVARLVRR